ncbi:hypothetical protein JRO89_XS12G0195100 [Xanthoceras sorbifolium]|uniref:Uncharacterized protein n=1 Tax=Xanthoceras sorbifolium TaxID=99658 RepID=A0ABQ8HD33_9ROSI|nr:hypothetical protein JRO89_XS12G0195100 [Xanthoceras sorbifolium]
MPESFWILACKLAVFLNFDFAVKQKSVKYRQDSSEGGACFVALKSLKSTKMPMMSLKAISVQALSSKSFLILDSAGDLHILHLTNSVAGSNINGHIRQLPHIMNVQKLAVLPDVSSRTQTIWITDGYHSMHTLAASEMDAAVNEKGRNEIKEKLMDISVAEAIFTGEKILDVVPLATNGILILGQVVSYVQQHKGFEITELFKPSELDEVKKSNFDFDIGGTLLPDGFTSPYLRGCGSGCILAVLYQLPAEVLSVMIRHFHWSRSYSKGWMIFVAYVLPYTAALILADATSITVTE